MKDGSNRFVTGFIPLLFFPGVVVIPFALLQVDPMLFKLDLLVFLVK